MKKAYKCLMDAFEAALLIPDILAEYKIYLRTLFTSPNDHGRRERFIIRVQPWP